MNGRVLYLDGVRGWAAFSVLLFHVLWETFGVLQPSLRHSLLSLVFNGPLAVSVFFVLSGDALLVPYLAKGKLDVIRVTAFRRYSRLTVPICMACTLTFVAMKLGWALHVDAAKVVHREDWLGGFLHFAPSLPELIRYVTYGVYFEHNSERSYLPFLWTMSIEMAGSMMVFVFAMQIEHLRRPALVALAVALFLYAFKSYYALFFLGACFAILRRDGQLQPREGGPVLLASWALLGLATLSCCLSPNIADDSRWINALRAACIVLGVHLNGPLVRILENRLSAFMGRISFALYLVHFVVLITLTSALILWFNRQGPLGLSQCLFIASVSVVAAVFLAWLFAKVEKRLLLQTNSWLARLER
jgi:peptidoglycan/LPS O-acetylase OafA/YrhL